MDKNSDYLNATIWVLKVPHRAPAKFDSCTRQGVIDKANESRGDDVLCYHHDEQSVIDEVAGAAESFSRDDIQPGGWYVNRDDRLGTDGGPFTGKQILDTLDAFAADGCEPSDDYQLIDLSPAGDALGYGREHGYPMVERIVGGNVTYGPESDELDFDWACEVCFHDLNSHTIFESIEEGAKHLAFLMEPDPINAPRTRADMAHQGLRIVALLEAAVEGESADEKEAEDDEAECAAAPRSRGNERSAR